MSFWSTGLSKISAILGLNTGATSDAIESLLEAEESKRVEQVKTFWEYYNGRSLPTIDEEGEKPYINICYALVEKSVSWLVGKMPKIRGRKDIHTLISQLHKELIDNSGGLQFFYESAQQGSVSGDCVLRIDYDPDVNDMRGGFLGRVMDSERTFVEYRNVGQQRKLSRVLILWDQIDEDGSLNTYAELWTDEYVRVYPGAETIISLDNRVDISINMIEKGNELNGLEYTTFENPFGEIPFVHIPNLLVSSTVHGRSDLHDVWVLNREMNEQLLSYKDNVDYHGNPLTLIFGASAKDLERGADKVWSNLPTEARVENLEVNQVHQQILAYMDLLKEAVGAGNGITMNLLALNEAIQQQGTSFASLKLSFLPLVELTERKRITYGKGYKEFFEKALRIMNRFYGLGLESLDAPDPKTETDMEEYKGILSTSAYNKLISLRTIPFYHTEILFEEHLPRSRTELLTDLQLESQNGWETIEGSLERLGVEDIKQKLNDLMEDAMFRKILEELSTPAPEMEGPPPPENGGAGNTKEPESANQLEDETGQSGARTETQRATKGQPGQ